MKSIVRYHALVALAFLAVLPGCGSQGAGEQPVAAGECKLETPINIRTKDPRRNYLTESLIKLANVQFYQTPKTVLLRKSMSEEPTSWEIELFEIFFSQKPTTWLGFYIEPQMSHSLGFGYAYGGSQLPNITGTSKNTAEGFLFSTSEPAIPKPEEQVNALELETANENLISLKITVPVYLPATSPSPSGPLEYKGNETLCVKSAVLK